MDDFHSFLSQRQRDLARIAKEKLLLDSNVILDEDDLFALEAERRLCEQEEQKRKKRKECKEQERIADEERIEKERLKRVKIEKEQLERKRIKERLKRVKIEKEQLERKRIKERLERERIKERLEREQRERREHAKEQWSLNCEKRVESLQLFLKDKSKYTQPVIIGSGNHEFAVSTISTIAVSLDSTLTLTGSGDNLVELWETVTGNRLSTLNGHLGRIESVAFSPCGNFALTGSLDKTARLWDIRIAKTVHVFEGHRLTVKSAVFSLDGKLILTGSWDGTAKLWNVESGEVVRTFQEHTKAIRSTEEEVWSVAFSHCGQFCLTGGYYRIKKWAVHSGELLWSIDTEPGKVHSVQFFPDGNLILSSHHDGMIRIWNAQTGHSIRSFKGHSNALWSAIPYPNLCSAIPYPDSNCIISCSKNKTVKIWDISKDELEIEYTSNHPKLACSVAISPNGRFLVSGDDVGEVVFRLLPNLTELLLDLKKQNEENKRIERERRWNHFCQTREQREQKRLEEECLEKTARKREGRKKSEAIKTARKDAHIKREERLKQERRIVRWTRNWSTNCQKRVESLQLFLKDRSKITQPVIIGSGNHEFAVPAVAISPDSTLVLTGGDDRFVKLWETTTGKELLTLEGHTERIKSVAFSPCGNFTLTGSVDQTARLWDIRTTETIRIFEGHRLVVESAVFSPDGKHILTGSWDCTAKLWNVESGKTVRTFQEHTDCVWSVAFSPCGRFCLTGGLDYRINKWEVHSGKLLWSIDTKPGKVHSAQFFLNGNLILSSHHDGMIRIWNAQTGRSIRSFKGHFDALWSAIPFPNSNYIISCSKDKTVKIWNILKDEEKIQYTFDHPQSVRSVAISPNGRFLVSGDDAGVLVFRLLPDWVEQKRIVKEERKKHEEEHKRQMEEEKRKMEEEHKKQEADEYKKQEKEENKNKSNEIPAGIGNRIWKELSEILFFDRE